MAYSFRRSALGPQTTSAVRFVRGAALALLLLLTLGGPVGAQGTDATPANLRCPGPGLVPVPPPAPAGWTPAFPIWEWRDLYSFASLNEPGYNSPVAVALGQDCSVYVADFERAEVVQLSPGGEVQRRLPLPGEPTRPGETGRLQGVAVDQQGNVYATEQTRNLVHKFSPQGQVTATWGRCTPDPGANRFCDAAREPGLFIGPSGIAVDGRGNVYVADLVNGGRIQKLSAANGAAMASWPMAGRVPGELFILGAMAIDSAGNLFVADGFNDVIDKFSPDGAVLSQFGGRGTEDGQLRIARGVAVDGAGNIYTADQDNWRVQKLSPDGTFLQQWRNCLIGTVERCDIPANGDQPGQFFDQRGLVVDGEGTLYVADYGNDRVQRLMIVGYTDPIPPPRPPGS
jgi:tripartite motif-containing protein 71